jgi:prepilin-type N-terminal cleavage/methylation domain-containing protein
MRLNKQSGFTLLELMAAMIIIAVIATLGFKSYKSYSVMANRIKAQDVLKHVSEGLDVYFLRHGIYPTLASYESMVNADSPLVQEDLVPVNLPIKDPWGHSYEGISGDGTYKLKCAGDANDKTGRAILIEPGKLSEDVSSSHSSEASDDRH